MEYKIFIFTGSLDEKLGELAKELHINPHEQLLIDNEESEDSTLIAGDQEDVDDTELEPLEDDETFEIEEESFF